jgi:hypothetical protein
LVIIKQITILIAGVIPQIKPITRSASVRAGPASEARTVASKN